MSLIAVVPLDRVQIDLESTLTGFEGFVLVWGVDSLRVYREGC